MIKNILVYRWNSNSDAALLSGLGAMGYHCVEFKEKFEDYHTDAEFVMKVINCMQAEDIHMVFSWDYFPLLASVCEMRKLPYVSWIYDCPLHTLLSKTVLYGHNYLFCFDRNYAGRLAELGCKNVYHFPLAVDTEAFGESIRKKESESIGYMADISFVGSLYSEKDKWLEAEGIPEYVKGYISGIEEAQIRVYGYNFVKEMIEEETARDILKKAGLQLGELYFDSPVQLVADLINREITEKERIRVMEKVSEKHTLHLYTNSGYKGNDNIKLCGIVDYQDGMPLVFHNSRINLNITSKTIESGIPQRVLDILACGGFCLTNYQPEIAEFFEDGRELVMYTDMEDLAQKTDWYLQHEEERAAIAAAGYEKVRTCFSMKEKLSEIIQIVEEDMD